MPKSCSDSYPLLFPSTIRGSLLGTFLRSWASMLLKAEKVLGSFLGLTPYCLSLVVL